MWCALHGGPGHALGSPPADLWAGCRRRPEFPVCALRMQRFDMGYGASSNPYWFWESKKVLSVLMGTQRLSHVWPADATYTRSPFSLYPSPHHNGPATASSVSAQPLVLEIRAPVPACNTPALWHVTWAWLESQDGWEGPIPTPLPVPLSPTNARGRVVGLLKDTGWTHWAVAHPTRKPSAPPPTAGISRPLGKLRLSSSQPPDPVSGRASTKIQACP